MKKNQIFACACLLASTLFYSGTLSAQWTTSGWATYLTNTNGNVGIGTTNPNSASLQFGNILGNKITMWGDGTNNYGFGVNGGNLAAYIPDIAGHRFSLRLNGYDGPEKFMVVRDGSVGLGGIYPANARLEFDNALGNKIRLFTSGTNNYGFGVNSGNLAAYIPNLAGHRFSIRLGDYNGAEVFTVANDGKVSTGSRVYVGATGTESGGYSLLQFKNTTSTTGGIIRSSLGTTDAGNAPLILEASSLNFSSGGAIRMTVNSAGNVGIGTGNLTHKLNVNGTIRAKEIRVETGWADYVFEPTYQLRPLAEVESYIQQNKHLPDVTSAADIQKDGLKVGEQMTQMMRKIEELTLYVIDLKKENTVLKERLENLEK